MYKGILLCIIKGLTNVVVESNPLIILNLIKRVKKPSWQLHQIIEDINNLVKDSNFIFCHILREGNNTADSLANLGESSKTTTIFTEVISLSSDIRASMKLEAKEIPNFRFRQKKKIFL